MVHTNVGSRATPVDARQVGGTRVACTDAASVEVDLLELRVRHHHGHEPANNASVIVLVVRSVLFSSVS